MTITELIGFFIGFYGVLAILAYLVSKLLSRYREMPFHWMFFFLFFSGIIVGGILILLTPKKGRTYIKREISNLRVSITATSLFTIVLDALCFVYLTNYFQIWVGALCGVVYIIGAYSYLNNVTTGREDNFKPKHAMGLAFVVLFTFTALYAYWEKIFG